jgi:hypothetical protein
MPFTAISLFLDLLDLFGFLHYDLALISIREVFVSSKKIYSSLPLVIEQRTEECTSLEIGLKL